MWRKKLIEDDEALRKILQQVKKVAVIGIKDSSRGHEAAFTVPNYLAEHGYEIIPVNPSVDTALGKKAYDRIGEVPDKLDMVLIFRAPNNIPLHAAEVLEMENKPAVFWMQTGIRNMDAAHKLAKAGIQVVQDHCIYREHLRLIRE